ncbi:hypothetical protein QFZ28_005852 [Neobacillus niacini]|nr:hypothetical protein [Neobacillus niacini]
MSDVVVNFVFAFSSSAACALLQPLFQYNSPKIEKSTFLITRKCPIVED